MKNSMQLASVKKQILAQLPHKYDKKAQLIHNSEVVSKHLLNNILSPITSMNTYHINYQQIQLYSANKQYLKRFYDIHEYSNKNKLLAEYYKFHIDFPYHAGPKINLIMLSYQEHKNKHQRMMIKKLMNESVSVSSTQQSHENSLRAHLQDKLQFSCKLKGLDQQQSSVMFEQICEKINVAFENVKPLYFYKGVYNDNVKEFKKFLAQQKQRKSRKGNSKQQKLKFFNQQEMYDSKKLEMNANRVNKGKQVSIIPLTRKIGGLSKEVRKNIHNSLVPSEANKIKRHPTLTKLRRNKTVTLKPQSFSKTHETISKDENTQKVIRRKSQNQIRIRKCKSSSKTMLSRTKSVNNFPKINEVESKNKQNEQKNYKKEANILSKKLLSTMNKQFEKKEQKNIVSQRILFRNGSKNIIKKPTNHDKQQSEHSKIETINNLIKNKLKLRA